VFIIFCLRFSFGVCLPFFCSSRLPLSFFPSLWIYPIFYILPDDEAAITRVDPASFPGAYAPPFSPKGIYEHHER
jgi:hypothetical protein